MNYRQKSNSVKHPISRYMIPIILPFDLSHLAVLDTYYGTCSRTLNFVVRSKIWTKFAQDDYADKHISLRHYQLSHCVIELLCHSKKEADQDIRESEYQKKRV